MESLLISSSSSLHQTPTLIHKQEPSSSLLKTILKNPSISFTNKISDEPRKLKESDLVKLSKNGQFSIAFDVLSSMVENGSKVSSETFTTLLQSCIDKKSVVDGKRIHGLLKSGGDFGKDAFVETKLVSLYAKCGSLSDARQVFDEMCDKNIFTWSAMIGGYAREEMWLPVVELFVSMIEGGTVTDAFLFPKVSQAIGNLRLVAMGRLMHSIAIRMGFCSIIHVSNSLIGMYWKCGELKSARELFDAMPDRDIVSWNSIISASFESGCSKEALQLFEGMSVEGVEPGLMTWNILIAGCNQVGDCDFAMELMRRMRDSGVDPDVFTWTTMISGFSHNKRASEALNLFVRMVMEGIRPNGVTIASVISACAGMKAIIKGMEIHAMGIKLGCVKTLLAANALIDIYAKCGKLDASRLIFDSVSTRDVFTWNSMIAGYVQAGLCGEAHILFSKMEDHGVRRNVISWNIMISGYMKSGDEDQALELFHQMENSGVKRNTSSWNAIITGLVQNEQSDKALQTFRQMQLLRVAPNSVTVLALLPACANLLSTEKVREIHGCVCRLSLVSEVSVGNALIDTYSKCGDKTSARTVFYLMTSKDIISWNSMIGGYVLHGKSENAMTLFDLMKGVTDPDEITYASMIAACGQLGKLADGEKLLSEMLEDFNIVPRSEHHKAMIELYSRSGRLREAADYMERMPTEGDAMQWSAFLLGCRNHGNLKLAIHAAEKLNELKHGDGVNVRILEQLYCLDGRAEDALRLRKHAYDNPVLPLGCSWIKHNNVVYKFFSGDKSNSWSDAIYAKLRSFREQKRADQYVYIDHGLPIQDEGTEDDVGVHSEKLAIAFGLVSNPSSKSIRVVKNLRMCSSCHIDVKLMSKISGCEIFVKDAHCLHDFKDGCCSCRDYW